MTLTGILRASTFLSLGLWAVPGAAAQDYAALFTTKSHSVYSSGPAVNVDTGTRRLGPGPQDLGKSYGGMFNACPKPLPSCETGAEAGADVKFNFGLNYGVKVNAGSLDAQYPVNVHIGTPADFANEIGKLFQIQSSFTVPGFTAPQLQFAFGGPKVGATLQVHSPTLEAFVDMDAAFEAFIGARACGAGICKGPSLGRYDVDASRNLIAFNRNGDGVYRIGDETGQLGHYVDALNGNLSARLTIPNLDAASSPANGSTATELLTLGRGNIAALGVNLAGLVSNLLPVPLSGNLGGIGYNLVRADGGITLDLRQTLSLSITPMQTYDFVLPVRQIFADGSISAPTTSITAPLGENVTVIASQRNVAIMPMTSLVARLTNVTELVIGGDVSVQALAADIFGFDIGPLYDSGSVGWGLVSFPIFQNSFDVAFGTVRGAPINFLQTSLVSGAADLGWKGLLKVGAADPDNPGLFSTEILVQNLDCPFAQICIPLHFADGSPVSLDQFGNFAFLTDTDALWLPTIEPGVPGTDEEQIAALADAGYTIDYAPLISPPGDPRPDFSVPEPASWMLMITGFGAAGAALRRRGRTMAAV